MLTVRDSTETYKPVDLILPENYDGFITWEAAGVMIWCQTDIKEETIAKKDKHIGTGVFLSLIWNIIYLQM